uniref:IRS-type PTB domain-containing protein n=1 Tax=Mesocestoides corti TaxID=53468 RepID=A0A0R3UM38_MESCO
LDFIFVHSPNSKLVNIQWTFLPFPSALLNSKQIKTAFRLNTSYHGSRYSEDLLQVTCPAALAFFSSNNFNRTCRLARLSISHVMKADEGRYRAHVTGDSDCFPCAGERQLRVVEYAFYFNLNLCV